MSIAIVAIAPFTAAEGGMAQQRGRQAQKQVKPAEQQGQSNPTVSRTEEPVEVVQEILGSRAGSRQVRSALQQADVGGVPQPQSLHELLQSVSSVSPRVQAKPMFRGVSQEWNGAASTGLVIQPKLTVGAAGDQYEQEADRVAAAVVEQIHSSGVASANDGQAVQRMGEDEDDLRMKPMPLLQRKAMDEDDELQLKPMAKRVGAEGGAVSADVEGEINRARGSGQPLATDLQERMGQAMGADFSGVRVHTDGRADGLNQRVGARAFTNRQDVFFRQGAYEPGSRRGQELLAHELTHVVQQNGVVKRSPQQQHTLISKIGSEPSTFKSPIQPSYSGSVIQRAVEINDVPISLNLLQSHRKDFIRDCTLPLQEKGISNLTNEQWDNIFRKMEDVVQRKEKYKFSRTSELMYHIHQRMDISRFAAADEVDPQVVQSPSEQEKTEEEENEVLTDKVQLLRPEEETHLKGLELIVAQAQAKTREVESDGSEPEVEKAQQEAPKAEKLVRQGAEADPVGAVILSEHMDSNPKDAQEAAQVVKSRPDEVAALDDLVIEEDVQKSESEPIEEPSEKQKVDLADCKKKAELVLVEIEQCQEKIQQEAVTPEPASISDKAKQAVKKTSDVVGPGMVAGPHTESQGIHNYPSFDPKYADTSAAKVTQGFSHFGVALSALGDLATLITGIIAVIDNKSLPPESAAEELFRINEEYKAWMAIHAGTFNLVKKAVDLTSLFASLTPTVSAILAGVSAGLGVGLSGIILVQQGRRAYKAIKRAHGLHQLQLQSEGGKRLRDYAKAKQMRKAAVSGAQAVAAALGVSYGIATIVAMATAGVAAGAALATTPVGWVLLGGAALIGIGLGVYKLVRWWQRRKREKRAKKDASDTVQTRDRMAELLIKLMKAPQGSKRRADAAIIAHTLDLNPEVIASKAGKDAIINKLASW